jgi:hypothetical protein
LEVGDEKTLAGLWCGDETTDRLETGSEDELRPTDSVPVEDPEVNNGDGGEIFCAPEKIKIVRIVTNQKKSS